MPDPAPRSPPKGADDRLVDALIDALERDDLVKLVVAGPTAAGPRRIEARRIDAGRQQRLAVTTCWERREEVAHLGLDAAVPWLRGLLPGWRHVDLFTPRATTRWERRGDGPARCRVDAARHAAPPPRTHDRIPQRAAGLRDAPWAVALGLVDGHGRPTAGSGDKVRQIERLVELVSHAVADLPQGTPLHVVDMGCGRGLLTAALAVWFRGHGWPQATVVGVEREPGRTDEAARLGLPGLSFVTASITEADLAGADVVVALHACDTASDDALSRATRAGARRILVAPCCHRELRPQILAPGALGRSLGHGILAERQAEWVTDALRAHLLATAGYRVDVIEMVRSEHTPRNVLLVGRRDEGADRDRAYADAVELARSFGVRHQALATHLGVSW